ncbi:34692_t:CDS:2 [Gigaspora margarita]|uniref:34692_t:CDS:1 n=1 Tax=Gigaspora margarita TaxID=4874 RepID=A0ABN7UGX8_GIGMA|nr:34692_t:CDS:2 [Gigaspora margarita]
MNLTDLNAEIKERITEGTKPSDLKKTNPKTTSIPAAPPLPEEKKGKKEKESGSKKTNATVSSVVSFRVEQIEDSVKNLDKDLAVFAKQNLKVGEELLEKKLVDNINAYTENNRRIVNKVEDEPEKADVVLSVDKQYEDYKATINAYEKDKETKAEEYSREIRKRDLEIDQLKKDVAERDRKVLEANNARELEEKARKDAQNTVLAQQYYREQKEQNRIIAERAQSQKKFEDFFSQRLNNKLQNKR